MLNNFKIRLAKNNDAPQMLAIYAPSILQSAISFEEHLPTTQDFIDRIIKSRTKHVWLVCEIDNQIAGYAYSSSFRPRPAYDWVAEVTIYINQSHHRRNIGFSLYTALHRIMALQNFQTALALMTYPNSPSESFHLKFGYSFDHIFKRIGFKIGSWHDVACLRKELNVCTHMAPPLLTYDELDPIAIEPIFDQALALIH